MLAGAQGIDAVLFVIAADEGIMPQTKEHLTVCQMLGVKKGIIAITKSDLVDDEWLELVMDDVKEFTKGTLLEDAPMIPVSSKTGKGLKELLTEIERTTKTVKPKESKGFLRLPVDRSFTIKGFGTVITGTVLSGRVNVGDKVEIYPSGLSTKVRNIQVHNQKVETSCAGTRTALNLSDIPKDKVKRGDLIGTAGIFEPSSMLDVLLKLSKDADTNLKSGARVLLHHLTSEIDAQVFLIGKDEISPGEECFAQLRLNKPTIAVFNDGFVIRNYSPSRVIGGGRILDPIVNQRFRKRFTDKWIEKLSILNGDNIEEKVMFILKTHNGIERKRLFQLLNLDMDKANDLLSDLIERHEVFMIGKFIYPMSIIEDAKSAILSKLKVFHEEHPLLKGISKEHMRSKLKLPPDIFEDVLKKLNGKVVDENGIISLSSFKPHVEGTKFENAHKMIKDFIESRKFAAPDIKAICEYSELSEETASMIVSYLIDNEGFEKVGNFIYSPKAMREIRQILKTHFDKNEWLTVGELKNYLGITRKHVIPLLEYLDSKGELVREGNKRKMGNLLT